MSALRVTVEHIESGETSTQEIPAGEYLILCAPPCRLDGAQVYPQKGTHVLTIKECLPAARPFGVIS